MKLSVNQLTFGYGSSPVLKGLSASFGPGITALVGPNGAGKSTLIKCLAGVLPTRGAITREGIFNPASSAWKGFAESMSYLPQMSPDICGLTVFEMVLLGLLDSLGLHVGQDEKAKVLCMLDRFGIGHLASRRLAELSGGQQQMVGLVQALVKEPRILLLDEPLNNLDFHHQFELLDHLTAWTNAEERVTIMAIHDLNLAARYADRVVVLNDGDIAAQGSPIEVLTPECLRSVYSIHAEVALRNNGILQITPISLVQPFQDKASPTNPRADSVQ